MNEPAALYLRVSTPEQNLDAQEADLRAYATRRNWEVSHVYSEKVTASGSVERDEYQRLLRDAARADRGWSHVVVWSLDRWSRDERFTKAVESIWVLEAQGISFHSYLEPALDTPSDGKPDLGREVLRSILPLMASFELRRLKERVRVAMREIKQGNRPTRSGRPVGRPVKVTLEKLKQICRFRKDGLGWKEIACRTSVRAPTCRRAFYNYTSGRWTVENTPVGEILVRHSNKGDGA